MPITPSGIDLLSQVKIFVVTFGYPMEATAQESWSTLENAVCAQARKEYARHPSLAQRVQYVKSYLLSKIRYLAQVLPPPTRHIQQLTTTCAWFIRRGAIFRVPNATLQRPKKGGGWAKPVIAMKCRALLLSRMRTLAAHKTSATAALLLTWDLTEAVGNTFNIDRIPSKLFYVLQYVLDMAYVSPTDTNGPRQKLRSYIYGVLRNIYSKAGGATKCV